jgi:hypothetical protein
LKIVFSKIFEAPKISSRIQEPLWDEVPENKPVHKILSEKFKKINVVAGPDNVAP